MTIRLFPVDLLAMLLATLCCLPVTAQDRLFVTAQPERSDARTRPGAPRVPRNTCPELEQLGYQFRQLHDIQLNIRLLASETPDDCSVNLFSASHHDDSLMIQLSTEFSWVATDLYHKPLYFEDAILERSGQAKHPLLQPWLSGAHFFGTFPIMPYRIGLDRPHDRVYALGHYRPGSPTPTLGNRLPFEVDAASFEALTWVGLLFLLP